MAAPRVLTTGIGSPVSADSSIVAAFEPRTPSTGMISPARTSNRSPMTTAAIGTSSMRSSVRRCASRGARSTSERRSCAARATAISSSTLPPEYISATTAPASGWPSASAALIDTSAIASTPSLPAKKSRTIETASPGHDRRGRKPPEQVGEVGPAEGVSANAGRQPDHRDRDECPPQDALKCHRLFRADEAVSDFSPKTWSQRLIEIKREGPSCGDVQAGMKCNSELNQLERRGLQPVAKRLYYLQGEPGPARNGCVVSRLRPAGWAASITVTC